jgi:hypothetical protein
MKALVFLCPAVLACLVAGCGGGGGTPSHGAPAPTLPAAAASVPHIDPYHASLDYARCMRARGIAHPNPAPNGDFHLTPAQERRMRASATRQQIEAGDKACFHYLKGTVSTQPLSRAAKRAALVPLRDLKRCLHGFGYLEGKPIVRNLSRGRAMFGFENGPVPQSVQGRETLMSAQHTCERRVHLAKRIDAIIKADRGEGY